MISPIDRRNFMAIAALMASSAALPASAEEQAKGGHEQSIMKTKQEIFTIIQKEQ